MKVTRFSDARTYVAPMHFDMRSLRLQGHEADGPQSFSTGLSHFLPGGGAGPDSSPVERVYVVLAGALTVAVAGAEAILGPLDSCFIEGGEIRTVKNNGNDVATMLVVMSNEPRS